MAKKRGRPKKDNINLKNEEVKQITMAQSTNNISSDNNMNYTLNQIRNRWANIFSKYANMGYDNLAMAWNQAATSQLNNPFIQNARIKQSNSQSIKLESEELQKALSNPTNSELTLQGASMDLYYTNYVYNSLIKLNRDTPKYNYYFLPQYVDKKEMKSDSFKEEAKRIDRLLKVLDPNLTFKTIATQVNLEGKCSYLPRVSENKKEANFFVFQKLNSNMIKLTGYGSRQQFVASFNMMIFAQPGYDITQYPPFIQSCWQKMQDSGMIVHKKGKTILNPKVKSDIDGISEWSGNAYMYWVRLPQDLCYTFYTDGAHPNAFPDMIGLFNDFSDLDDYRWLQANLLSKGVNSVLTAQVPLSKDAKAGTDATIITPDTVLGYSDLFGKNISGNIFPFFAPFTDFKLHTLENQPESMNIIYDRTRDLIATSGNASLLNISEKPSIANVKASQNIQASKVDYLTRQFEDCLNDIINHSFGFKYTWKVFLWGDIFNKNDDFKNLKELVLSGLEGMIPKLLSSMGMTIEDYSSANDYISTLGIKVIKVAQEEQNKLKTKQNKEKSDISDNVGRPHLSEDEIENDNTAISTDIGNNVSDIKEFTKKDNCCVCGCTLNDDEEYICSNCLEEIYSERLEN